MFQIYNLYIVECICKQKSMNAIISYRAAFLQAIFLPISLLLIFFNASFSNKLLLSTQVSHITKAMFSIVSCILM